MWYQWLLFTFVLIFQEITSEDYYFREYTGKIPDDAIIGGKDINNENIFIGQAYLHDCGLIVVEIFPGVKEVQAPFGTVAHLVKTHIKILCGNQHDFYWSPANATHLDAQIADKTPVIGGHENPGPLYVGRINADGADKIGKIAAFNKGNARLWYSSNGKELGVLSYEVLLYKDKSD